MKLLNFISKAKMMFYIGYLCVITHVLDLM